MVQLFHLRVDQSTSGAEQHLPYFAENSRVFIRRVDVYCSGGHSNTIEELRLSIFGEHGGGILGTRGTSDITIATFGQTVTRLETTIEHPIHHATSTRIVPKLSGTLFNGTTLDIAGGTQIIVHILLEIQQPLDTGGREGANQMQLRQEAVAIAKAVGNFRADADETRLKTVVSRAKPKFGYGGF